METESKTEGTVKGSVETESKEGEAARAIQETQGKAGGPGMAGKPGNSCCMQCQKVLSHKDIGAYKKFVNRGADRYLCIGCLAKHFGIPVFRLEEKIAYFKAQGCTLFV